MNDDYDEYPKHHTLDNGRYRFLELLGGLPEYGRWLGERCPPDSGKVLISFRYSYGIPEPRASHWAYVVPGIAPFLFVGSPDGHLNPDKIHMPGWKCAVVVGRPDGTTLDEVGRLTPEEVVRLGLGLCDTILSWAKTGNITRGLRPETVYVTKDNYGFRFSGATPRMFFALGNDGRRPAFSYACYEPPAHNSTVEVSVDDEVFVVGLLMWFALLGEHPYRKMPGHPYDYDNIWEDVRHPFTGPAELGRLLDAVLVADPDRRMKTSQFRAELVQLAHTWNVELPPFPPPGLWAGPASKKMTE